MHLAIIHTDILNDMLCEELVICLSVLASSQLSANKHFAIFHGGVPFSTVPLLLLVQLLPEMGARNAAKLVQLICYAMTMLHQLYGSALYTDISTRAHTF